MTTELGFEFISEIKRSTARASHNELAFSATFYILLELLGRILGSGNQILVALKLKSVLPFVVGSACVSFFKTDP